MKPGLSFNTAATNLFPRRQGKLSPTFTPISIASSEDFSPLMTSINLIRGAVLKKCIPIHLSSLFVAEAISEIDIVDVFVDIIQWGGEFSSQVLNTSFFTSIFSTTASMIKSASFMADAKSMDVFSLPITSAAFS
ncbi:hypothetical protein ES703_34365 [subsurface metagenome]